MLSYDQVKKWCKEHQKEITVGVCFVLIFLVGFGTGRYDKEAQAQKRKSQSNYTKTTANQQKTGAGEGEVKGTVVDNNNDKNSNKAGEAAVATGADGKCLIKGNISSTGMIYHMPGGASYEKTNPEKCFNTEAEAKAAGFRKASR